MEKVVNGPKTGTGPNAMSAQGTVYVTDHSLVLAFVRPEQRHQQR